MRKENLWKKFVRVVVKHALSLAYHIVYRVKINGKENLKDFAKEGGIICANHLNTIDAVGIVVLNRPKIRFVAKIDLYKVPAIRWLARLFDIIPVNREKNDIDSIKLCLKSLKNDEILGIFPEGTRNGLEKGTKVKNGAAYLASKTNKKILPIGIKGNFKPFTKVTFNIGEPIDVLDFKSGKEDWIDDATSVVMKRIVDLTK